MRVCSWLTLPLLAFLAVLSFVHSEEDATPMPQGDEDQTPAPQADVGSFTMNDDDDDVDKESSNRSVTDKEEEEDDDKEGKDRDLSSMSGKRCSIKCKKLSKHKLRKLRGKSSQASGLNQIIVIGSLRGHGRRHQQMFGSTQPVDSGNNQNMQGQLFGGPMGGYQRGPFGMHRGMPYYMGGSRRFGNNWNGNNFDQDNWNSNLPKSVDKDSEFDENEDFDAEDAPQNDDDVQNDDDESGSMKSMKSGKKHHKKVYICVRKCQQ